MILNQFHITTLKSFSEIPGNMLEAPVDGLDGDIDKRTGCANPNRHR